MMIEICRCIASDAAHAAAGMLKGVAAGFLLHDVHPVRRGEWVVVHAAAGGVGTLLTQWASALGARVIATVSDMDKARLALITAITSPTAP